MVQSVYGSWKNMIARLNVKDFETNLLNVYFNASYINFIAYCANIFNVLSQQSYHVANNEAKLK